MPRPSPISASAVLLLAAALSACDPAKPPDTPEGAATASPKENAEADPPKDKEADKDAPAAGPEPSGEVGGQAGAGAPKIDKSLSLDTYEMMPSDCNALGAQYGQVARSDQMSALPPRLSEKQRSATAAQVDKVVSKLEESWTNSCHASLENKAVDHDAIKCALAAKTVKEFDTCINGAAGTPQPSGKKKK